MSDDMTILRFKNPNLADYLDNWRKKNEGRTFDFSNPHHQSEFFEALSEMGKHIAHTAQTASLKTVISVDGVSTVYVSVTPKLT